MNSEFVEREVALAALRASQHVLFTGPPGVGKTSLAKELAAATGKACRRVQFSADMYPMDITGANIVNPATGELEFRPGPVFEGVLIADEINRAPGRVHSTLLEAMEEQQVTVEGHSHSLVNGLQVLATRNAEESAGAFRLPQALLDRFAVEIEMGYPDLESEYAILRTDGECMNAGFRHASHPSVPVIPVHIEEELLLFVAKTLQTLRRWSGVRSGPSPRAGLSWVATSRAIAVLRGRDFVIPEDLVDVGGFALLHRMEREYPEPTDSAWKTRLGTHFQAAPKLGGRYS